jgi:hypothetical protein
MKKLLLSVILIAFSFHIFSQNCTQSLRSAERAYAEGRIAEIPTILELCLKGGFTKAERIRAYRLLTLSYLYQYETSSAEQAMLSFLKEIPDYKIDPTDPAPFVKLYKRFRTTPLFLVGLESGINFSQPRAFAGRSVLGSTYAHYTSKLGFQAGATGEIAINSKFSAEMGLQYFLTRFQSTVTGGEDNFAKSTVEVTQSQIGFQAMGKYEVWRKQDFSVFVNMGLSSFWIADLTRRISQEASRGSLPSLTPNGSSIHTEHKNLTYSLITGVGTKYKLGKNYVVFRLQYWWGLTNQTVNPWDEEENYLDPFDSGFVPDDYRTNNLTFSVAYLFPVYKPKLIKK